MMIMREVSQKDPILQYSLDLFFEDNFWCLIVAYLNLKFGRFLYLQIKHFIEFPDTVNMADILICQDIWKGSSKIAYTVISSCAQYLFPVILVITLYLSIYLKLRNRPQVCEKTQKMEYLINSHCREESKF